MIRKPGWMLLVAGTLSFSGARTAIAGEHAGQEHAGKEHGGKKVEGFTAAQIKSAMNEHIASRLKEGGGTLAIKDEKTGEALSLEFVKIHDPVRKIEGKGYFACTDFHPAGAPAAKLYDLDFWLNAEGDKLVVTETRIHKHPELKKKTWKKVARYTFENDAPVEVK